MENYSSMNEIQSNYVNNSMSKSPPKLNGDNSEVLYNLEAHTSSDMKVKRPRVVADEGPAYIPRKNVYSDQAANEKIKNINSEIFRMTHNGQDSSQYTLKPLDTDRFDIKIYESRNKENEKHGFNFKRYFTIFGIIALLTAAISYLCKRGK